MKGRRACPRSAHEIMGPSQLRTPIPLLSSQGHLRNSARQRLHRSHYPFFSPRVRLAIVMVAQAGCSLTWSVSSENWSLSSAKDPHCRRPAILKVAYVPYVSVAAQHVQYNCYGIHDAIPKSSAERRWKRKASKGDPSASAHIIGLTLDDYYCLPSRDGFAQGNAMDST
jgi:hypothetical protein